MDNQKHLATLDLGKKHRMALDRLSSENSYLPNEFVSIGQIGPGIGLGTMSDLIGWHLVEEGKHSVSGIEGYRLTELGKAASVLPPKQKPPRRNSNLRTLIPRLKEPKPRF
jgi:hypothetical protein